MATMERLFVQIFDHKNLIIDQLNHHKLLYDQNLASKVLIQGITPPPWLFPASDFPSSSSSDLKEINKVDFISGLLLPHPRTGVSYSKGPCSFHDNRRTSSANIELPDSSCVGKCANSKDFDTNGPEVLPPCHVNTTTDVPMLVTASPHDQLDKRILDVFSMPDESLARIQRSRSRQKALELRNSAKANAKSGLSRENHADVCADDTLCRDTEQPSNMNAFSDPIKQLAFSIEDCTTKETVLEDCMNEGRNCDVCVNSLSISTGKEKKEEEIGCKQSSEKKNEIYGGGVTRSGSCCPRSVGDHGLSKKKNELNGSGSARFTACESKKVGNDNYKSTEKILNAYSGRVTRSRSSQQEHVGEDENDHEMHGVRITRSRNSVARQPNTDSQRNSDNDQKKQTENDICNGSAIRSRSCSHQSVFKDRRVTEKSNETHSVGINTFAASGAKRVESNSQELEEVCSRKGTRSGSSLQHYVGGDHLIDGNCNGLRSERITHSENQEAPEIETEEQRIKYIDMSVKPVQLDFDDVKESCPSNLPSHDCGSEEPKKSVGGASLVSDESAEKLHLHNQHVKLDTVADVSLLVQCDIPQQDKSASRFSTGKRTVGFGNFGIAHEEKVNSGCSPTDVPHADRTLEGTSLDQLPSLSQHVELNSSSGKLLSQGKYIPSKEKEASRDCRGKERASLSKLGISAYGDEGNSGVVPSYASSGGRTSEFEALTESLGSRNSERSKREVEYTLPKDDRWLKETCLLKNYPTCLQKNQEDAHGGPFEDSEDPRLSSEEDETARFSSQTSMSESKERKSAYEEAAACSLPNVDVDPVVHVPSEKQTDEDESEQPAVMCSEEAKIIACFPDDGKLSQDHHMKRVARSSLCRTSAGSSGAPASDLAVDTTLNDSKCKHAVEKVESESSSQDVKLHVSTDVRVDACSAPPSLCAGLIIHPESSFCSMMKGSWPCYKRRKIECQTSHKSASPSIGVKPFDDAKKDDFIAFPGGVKDHSSAFSWHLSSDVTATGTNLNIKWSIPADHRSSPMQQEEDDVSLEARIQQLTEENKGCSTEEGLVRKDRTISVLDSESWFHSLLHPEDEADANAARNSNSTQMEVDKGMSLQVEDLVNYSSVSPLMEYMDLASADETMPVFEGFIIDENKERTHVSGDGIAFDKIDLPKNATERASFLGQLCKSASLSTPLSHLTPDINRSVPIGLLEHAYSKSNLLDDDARVQLKASYSLMNDVNHAFQWPSARLARDVTKPYSSPIRLRFEENISKSGGSGKQGSSNPELVCFPIEEDPEISEENLNMKDASEKSDEDAGSRMQNSSMREPLHDLACNALAPNWVSERGSLESVTTEINAGAVNNRESRKIGAHQRRTRLTRQGKENQNFSFGANSIRKPSDTRDSRFSKPKLSGKSLKTRGGSLLEKEPKRNNIVSNMKSFLPLVQQKQAAAVAPGKRDVKVKALEAADAAKRLAEKRENERKQKKEALKLERARLEQENLRQMEMQKKMKEEERKKRDADNAARKRLREEEERKGKERKRMRLEEARKQRIEKQEKMHAEELRKGAEDQRAHPSRESNNKREKQVDGGKKDDNFTKMPANEVVGNRVSPNDAGEATGNHHEVWNGSDSEQVEDITIREGSTPNCDGNRDSIRRISREQSYEISPYQCSDDEDEEEEDEVRDKKFVPKWASKRCVAEALIFLQKLDPDVIFPPGSFCSLDEALLPRRPQQKYTVRQMVEDGV